MQIKQIQLYAATIPLTEPFVISLGAVYDAENVIVRITTDNGWVGYGECSPYWTIAGETQATCMAVGQLLAKAWIGKAAGEVEARLLEHQRLIAGNRCIKSAFDMALYDLLAQQAGMPLYALWGGQNKPLHTDMTVGLDTPENMAAAAAKFVEEGFPTIKVKLGLGLEQDHARIQAIRNAIGAHFPLQIDANQGWDEPTAIQVLEHLAAFHIKYCEAPVAHWNVDAMSRIREKSPIPIMADESVFDHLDALRHIKAGACDYINIKLAKSGGLHNALKITALAESAGMSCQVGCFSETRLGLTALAHLALARTNIRYHDMDSALMLAYDPVEGGLQYGPQGSIVVPDTPGLGATISAAYLGKWEKVTVDC